MHTLPASSPPPTEPIHGAQVGRVLVVDDDEGVRRVYSRALESAGHEVVVASSATEAAPHFGEGLPPFDCVISDIVMPGMTGIELLRKIRQVDLDVAVVMATGGPTMGTAIAAVEEGATRYLVKPFEWKVLAHTVGQCINLSRMARLKRQVIEELGGPEKLMGDRGGLSVRLDAALSSLHLHYQPIVRLSDRSLFGYEALVRTGEASIAHPGALFDVAERLKRVSDVSRRVRELAPEPFAASPERGLLLVNLHLHDLLDEALYSERGPLAGLAGRVVLEITERAALTDVSDLRARVDRLRKLGFRIAVDDLGAGYAGLNTFADLEPEVVKLDMTLVRGIHRSSTKQKVVRSMASLCREMGLEVICEGVEVLEELACLQAMGCDVFQGFLFARAGPAFVDPTFPSLRAPGS
ncbi:MAG: EAL domain-containing protein [Archangium sp.]|nr:EAL domain-containing protein [Archangium sp.]